MTVAAGTASPADRFVDLARRLAEAARPIARRYFRADEAALQFKANGTPVTAADLEIEAAIRAILGTEVPDHGIYGEEEGAVRTDAEYVWVIDPIDGTKSFATGKPLWGVLIALAHRGRPVLGIIDQPHLDERWLGIDGRQTTFNGKPAKVRSCTDLKDAWLYTTTPDMFQGADRDAFDTLKAGSRHCIYGADCYAYGLVASGYTDLVAEANLKPYDYCALVPVIAGAGGVISDWQGKPLTIASGSRTLAAGDARIHKAALAALAG